MNPVSPVPTRDALDQKAIHTLRFLAADTVEKAKSGHPGMPMGMADVAYTMWTKFMRWQPGDPACVVRGEAFARQPVRRPDHADGSDDPPVTGAHRARQRADPFLDGVVAQRDAVRVDGTGQRLADRGGGPRHRAAEPAGVPDGERARRQHRVHGTVGVDRLGEIGGFARQLGDVVEDRERQPLERRFGQGLGDPQQLGTRHPPPVVAARREPGRFERPKLAQRGGRAEVDRPGEVGERGTARVVGDGRDQAQPAVGAARGGGRVPLHVFRRMA